MTVKTYNFIKESNGYRYTKGDTIYPVSNEMMECFKRQYKRMGYYVFDFGFAVVMSYADDSADFLKQLYDRI